MPPQLRPIAFSLALIAAVAALLVHRWSAAPPGEAAAPVATPKEATSEERAALVPPPAAPAEARVELAAPRSEEPRATSAPAAPDTVRAAAAIGRLLDSRGQPIAGAGVQVAEAQGTSGEDGRFRVEAAPGDSILLEARKRGYARHQRWLALLPGRETDLGELVLPDGGAVRGRVLDEAHRPVAGAEVVAVSEDPGAPIDPHHGPHVRADEARTDERGEFALLHAPAGALRVGARTRATLWSSSGIVELAPGGEVRDVLLLLQPIPEGDLIELIVQAPDGAPLPRAQIAFTVTSGRYTSTGSSQADEHGVYRQVVTDFSRAPHDFRVSDPQERYRPGVASAVPPGTRGRIVRLELPERLRVRVRDGEDRPVESFALDLLEPGSEHGHIRREPAALARPGGELELVAPGEPFDLLVRAEGHALARQGPFHPGRLPAEVTLRLQALPGVRGVVLAEGRPVAGARVGLHPTVPPGNAMLVNGLPARSQPFPQAEARSDGEGRFSLTLREAGRYYLRAEAGGLAAAELGPLDLVPGSGADGLRLELSAGGRLEGRVLVPAGGEERDLVIGITRGDGFGVTARTDAEGRYRFERLTPGRWLVKRLESEIVRHSTTSSMRDGGAEAELPWSCEVREGETTRFDLDLRGERTCTVRGFLRLNGRPAAGWIARVQDEDSLHPSASAVLDAEGRFALSVREPGAGATLQLLQGEERGARLWQPLALDRDELTWERDIACGRLHVRLTASMGELRLEDEVGGTLHFESEALLAPGAVEHVFEHVPAGRVKLSGLTVAGDVLAAASFHVRAEQTDSGSYP